MSGTHKAADEDRPSPIAEDSATAIRLSSEDPKLRARWASKSRRRGAVVAMAFLLLATVGMLLLMNTAAGLGTAPAIIFLTIAFLYLGAELNKFTRTQLRYGDLDEREQAERDRATRIGHITTTWMSAALVAVAAALQAFDSTSLLFGDDGLTVPIGLLLPPLYLLAMVHAATSTAYLAWTLPDDILDD